MNYGCMKESVRERMTCKIIHTDYNLLIVHFTFMVHTQEIKEKNNNLCFSFVCKHANQNHITLE